MKNAVAVIAAGFAANSAASALPPIEAYGELPSIGSVALSPDGGKFAFIRQTGGKSYFVVSDPQTGAVGAIDARDLKANRVSFPTSSYAVFVASETASMIGVRDEWEHSGAFAYNVENKGIKVLLNGSEGLYPAQTGLGRIVGKTADSEFVFMPAFMDVIGGDPRPHLMKVSLNTGKGKSFEEGSFNTVDWIVNKSGVILAREDADEENDSYRIFTKRNGKLETIFEEKIAAFPFTLVGVTADETSLVIIDSPESSDTSRVRRLGFDGSISEPIFGSDAKDIESVLTDFNRAVVGVEYAGLTPSYEFFDASLTSAIEDLGAIFPEDSTHLVDWTDDLGTLLFYVEGGATAPSFHILDRNKGQISRIANAYEAIGDDDVSPIAVIEYKARDGRKIPTVVTRPRGTDLGQKLPLIVMPHGGPASHDGVGFDWLAQYFASRGYLVLQPNFRGSDGFGLEHLEAGYGEWGGKMQDDITDGVSLLVKKGWADPNRICIIGASYGGYAALAGGAFTPDLYKCVAAIAPVSDMIQRLDEVRARRGKDSWSNDYLSMAMGDRKEDKALLAARSPINAAANFKAPVLLIHGDDDTVVPVRHSLRMEDALKKAGKSVRLVKLKNEDHHLSFSETRLQTLRELDKFVAETIGRNE